LNLQLNLDVPHGNPAIFNFYKSGRSVENKEIINFKIENIKLEDTIFTLLQHLEMA